MSCAFALQAQEKAADKNLVKKATNFLVKAITNTTSTETQEKIDKNLEEEESITNFKLALVSLEKTLEETPENAAINYKLGLCYYFSADRQLEALPCFKKAIKNLNLNFDFISPSETTAPYNALYFLAATYLEANKPDSALKYFSLYKDKSKVNAINCDREIAMCYNAKESDKLIRNVQVKSIGSAINSRYSEKNPVVKIDNTFLFFSSNRPAKTSMLPESEDIYVSMKEASGGWGEPQLFPYNTEYDEAPLCMAIDGKTLYFKRTIKGNADIYYCKFEQAIWSKPLAFSEINSSANENGFSITANNKTIYFSSDKNKGLGKFDIFECKLDKNGKWGAPMQLTNNINSSFNEISPFISPDGEALFFASDGYENKGVGAYDIYFSNKNNDNSWSAPQSIGFPINTTRNDVNYYIGAENKRYFSRLNADRSYDIYTVDGEGIDFEAIAASTEVIKINSEMNVTQILETVKEVEKEVEVIKAVEKEVEKEVEVIKAVETEVIVKEEVEVATIEENIDIAKVNIEKMAEKEREELVKKVKKYLSEQLTQNQSVSFKTMYFDLNKSNLSLLSINELKVLVEFMNENPQTKIEVIGNTDNTGKWQTNLNLSNQRAKEVYDFLINNKVSANRMYFYGRASAVPLVENDTEENRSKNRRVEVVLLK